MNIQNVAWSEIELACNLVIDHLQEHKLKPEYVYGVERGGLIPAVILSHKLGVPFVNEQVLDVDDPNRVLVVDDIWETGETMEMYAQRNSSWILVTLFVKEKDKTRLAERNKKCDAGNVYPNKIDAMITMPDNWLVFPWEDANKALDDYQAYRNKREW